MGAKPELKPSAYFLLSMRYMSPAITLQTVIADYFPHLEIEEAKRRANKCTLPFPTFKADESRKAPHMVNISDLAAWLDSQHSKAADDYHKLND